MARIDPVARQLILASAGSGKTYRLSSQLIALLAAEEAPESILASTFTRKAAGEILDRVLVRLARAGLDEAAAKELADQLAVPGVDRQRCLELLTNLTRRMHRLNIGTLDSFFMRTVGSFALELGLPPRWTIGDEVGEQLLRADAVHAMLRAPEASPDDHAAQLVELVRLIHRGDAGRSIHRTLLAMMDGLHEIDRQTRGVEPDPWRRIQAPAGYPPLSDDQLEEHLEALAAVEVPTTQKGTPNVAWQKALAQVYETVARRDWEAMIEIGLVGKLLAGEGQFSRQPIPDDFRAAMEPLIEQAKAELLRRLVHQADAMAQLVRRYDAELQRLRRQRGQYSFGEVTHTLAEADPQGAGLDIFYRLDGRMRHLLLDEFQDTSVTQWHALAPLVGEHLAHADGDRASLIVADPKQSIYGWRGAAPNLVYQVRDDYALAEEPMHHSYRSSQVVLDLVNEVFDGIATNPVLAAEAEAVADWARAFEPHEAKRDLPGHVRITVAPKADDSRQQAGLTLRRAADRVVELAGQMPEREIGVLVRTNAAVARMIFELRQRDLYASEEGGNPLTDSPAVVSVLAVLTLADHPDDRLARYHVARTPIGPVVGLTDHEDGRTARRVAHAVRRSLLVNGYGPTLQAWVDRLADQCSPRDLRRLLQLVELGCRFEQEATIRPGRFVQLVRARRIEDPTTAPVRVMTVHQSKGLEFDAVVLPELDASMLKGGGHAAVMYRREHPTGPITAVFPYLKKSLRDLFPQTQPLFEQQRARQVRDALSVLYVAMTRAKHAVHLVIAPPGKSETAVSPARIVRAALGPDRDVEPDDPAWHEAGDPDWWRRADDASAAAATPETIELAPRLAPSSPETRRLLPRRSPSQLEGGPAVDLTQVLRLDSGEARHRGSIVHGWCERIGWLEDGLPDDDELRAVARRLAPAIEDDELDRLLDRFGRQIEAPAIEAMLRRDRYGAADPTGLALHRELPFVQRTDDGLLRGNFDRVVVIREDGRPTAAEVIDFKTDRLDGADAAALADRAEHYRPQLEAYRDAAARRFRLDPAQVRAYLLFLDAGVAREVG